MQGLLTFRASILADGTFFAPIGEARVSFVDVRDIAAAAVALTQPGHWGQTYTITGPAALSHVEVAEALTQALCRPARFHDAPPDAFAAALAAAGMPRWQIDGLLEDYAHYRRGEAVLLSPAVREVTEQAPRDVATFAWDYASAIAPAPS
jgi:uncharacterized protein YbjT (DUF2867 family)